MNDTTINPCQLADSEEDGELLARYQQYDDHTALTEIRRRYTEKLEAHARRHLEGFTSEAEDMVQHAFLKFHETRHRHKPKSCVSALLYKIVENCCKDYLDRMLGKKRDRSRTVSLHVQRNLDPRGNQTTRPSLDPLPDPKSDPARLAEKMEVDELLDSALTPKQAEAIRLRMEGHTAEQAAKLLNLPPTTVRKRIKDGINAMKRLIAHD